MSSTTSIGGGREQPPAVLAGAQHAVTEAGVIYNQGERWPASTFLGTIPMAKHLILSLPSHELDALPAHVALCEIGPRGRKAS
ncbi:hypothetical protein [Nonomuraea sp. NPDC049758]|uniref:hypothetical protein n=1 Tax=Nonomuraea sp. NPDC049758 TaxID=3154360 RepID=UPI0034368D4D